MKNSEKVQVYVLLISFIAIFFYGCKKDDANSLNTTTDEKIIAIINPALTYGTMTDQDGNTYKTIKIGSQTWMAENLRATKYRNGEALPEVGDNTTWSKLTTGAFCIYDNDPDKAKIATFGRLYNWYAVSDSRNIAPIGWHVPTDYDWTKLITHLKGDSVAGGKMKEIGIGNWAKPNTAATNDSGFTALPAGNRSSSNGAFDSFGYYANYWSSTQHDATHAWSFYLFYLNDDCSRSDSYKNAGFSIRCVKDTY
jgi:uncharacterized protein (TIGR02145 family)